MGQLLGTASTDGRVGECVHTRFEGWGSLWHCVRTFCYSKTKYQPILMHCSPLLIEMHEKGSDVVLVKSLGR